MKTTWSRLVLSSFVALGLSSNVSSFAAAESTLSGSNGTGQEQKEKQQLQYRQDNNLDISNEAISKALHDPKAQETVDNYGVALTASEAAYIKERDALMAKYAPVINELMLQGKEASEVGTFYQETDKGLKFVVGLKNEAESAALAKTLKETVPAHLLVIKKVAYSEKELNDKLAAIQQDKELLASKGIEVTGVTVDVIRNLVEVSVSKDNVYAKQTLHDLYGKHAISVIKNNEKPKLEAQDTQLDLMLAGLKIYGYDKNGNYGGYCTLGFTATKNGVRYLVTAGHCVEDDGTNLGIASWWQGATNGEYIGSRHYWSTDFSNGVDVGLIKLASDKKITNYVYKYNAWDSTLTSYESSLSNVVVGDKVCLTGATTGFHCGQVASKNDNGFIKTSGVDSRPGDSGGIWWYGGKIKGIHSQGNYSFEPSTTARYGHVSKALTYGGAVTPYLQSGAY